MPHPQAPSDSGAEDGGDPSWCTSHRCAARVVAHLRRRRSLGADLPSPQASPVTSWKQDSGAKKGANAGPTEGITFPALNPVRRDHPWARFEETLGLTKNELG